jgi:hypothetical protein
MPGAGSVDGAAKKAENMKETRDQATTPSASPGGRNGHRRPVRGTMGELEGRWLLGRAAPYTDKLDQRFKGGQATG